MFQCTSLVDRAALERRVARPPPARVVEIGGAVSAMKVLIARELHDSRLRPRLVKPCLSWAARADRTANASKRSSAVELDDSIRFGLLIHDISRLRRIVIDRILKPLGVTRSQWWVMVFLSRRDGMTQTNLASDLDLSKVALGGLLGRLEAAGLVMRRADDVDARARRVFLTKAGHTMMRNIRTQVRDVERELLGPNSDEEIASAVAVLRKMKQKLIVMVHEEGDSGR